MAEDTTNAEAVKQQPEEEDDEKDDIDDEIIITHLWNNNSSKTSSIPYPCKDDIVSFTIWYLCIGPNVVYSVNLVCEFRIFIFILDQ